MRWAPASSTRCASASRSSSSRSCASRRFDGQRDDDVLIGWDAQRQHPGDRLMASATSDAASLSAPGAHAARIPLLLFLLVGFAAPLLAVIGYSFMPPRTFGLWQAPTLEQLRRPIFNSIELHLLPLVAGPRGADGRPPGADLLSGRLRPGAGVRPLGDAADAAVHHPAVRVGERPALWLDPVLHQERRAARHAQVAVRHRARKLCCSPTA